MRRPKRLRIVRIISEIRYENGGRKPKHVKCDVLMQLKHLKAYRRYRRKQTGAEIHFVTRDEKYNFVSE